MARGWESKAVEAQIESAEDRKRLSSIPRKSPEELELERKKDALLLTRTRVLHDLQTCCNARYRPFLEAALAHVDEQLKQLS